MSLLPSFVILQSDNSETISVYDNTGAYSATNAGGYGSPNPTIGDVTEATLAISLRSSDGTFAEYNTIDVYPTLPNVLETPFEISGEDAGFGTDALFPDGIYQMVYTVSGDGFSESVTEYIVLQASINACYTEAAVTLSQCACNCDSLDNGIIEMDFYLGQLERAKVSGNLNWIANILSKLTNLCTACGCGC